MPLLPLLAAGTLPSLWLRPNVWESVLREVLLSGDSGATAAGGPLAGLSHVELYEQAHAGGSWRRARSGSPGKLAEFEEELFRGAGAGGGDAAGAAAAGGGTRGAREVLVAVGEGGGE